MTTPQNQTDGHDFAWAVKVMRVGYLGRALVYLTVAGISLWAIFSGGEASGTSDSLSRLEHLAGGPVVLALICLGMLSYAIWRLVDSLYDLEDYGTDPKGIVARLGMIVTGTIHLGFGAIAAGLLVNTGSGGTSLTDLVAQVMDLPGGRWLVGGVSLLIAGAGLYYIKKGWSKTYRRHLKSNRVTRHAGWLLTAGVIANGVIVLGVGALFLLSAIRRNPGDAGGMGKVFDWAYSTPYGAAVVVAICIGLLGFSLFCLVNAIWRIVPKAADDDIETLARALE